MHFILIFYNFYLFIHGLIHANSKINSTALSSVVEHLTVVNWLSESRRFDSSSADFFAFFK